MNRGDWQALAETRLAEARGLLALNPPCPDGAYYLAGYAVECGLKAVITLRYAQYDWPDKGFVMRSHTHDLEELAKLADIETQLAADIAANVALSRYWDIVKDWDEGARYRRYSLVQATAMVEAVGDNVNGVLPWIKARW